MTFYLKSLNFDPNEYLRKAILTIKVKSKSMYAFIYWSI